MLIAVVFIFISAVCLFLLIYTRIEKYRLLGQLGLGMPGFLMEISGDGESIKYSRGRYIDSNRKTKAIGQIRE